MSDGTLGSDGEVIPPAEADAYQFRGARLTPNVIRDLAPRLITSEIFRRSDVVEAVAEFHVSHGGLPATNAQNAAKKALSSMADDGLIEKVGATQMWRYTQRPVPSPDDGLPAELMDPDASSSFLEFDDAAIVEGAGSGYVYVYYFEAYRRLAESTGAKSFPVKIGMSSLSSPQRIFEQQGTAMPEAPRIGYVFRTDVPARLERVLHGVLSMRGQQLDEAPGSEWFNSTPTEVQNIVHWVLDGDSGVREA